MKSFKEFWPVYITLFLVVLCVVLFATMARWSGLKLNMNPKNIAGLLGPITLASAFIERAVEVVISPWRDLGADRLTHKLDGANRNVTLTALAATANAAVANAANADPTMQSKDREVAVAAAVQSNLAATVAATAATTAAVAVTDYHGLTQKYAYALSLLLGVLVAYSGVRGLENLCVENALKAATWGQQLMLEVLDIVLSGAVMAGGANGIHSIVNLVTTAADATSEKVKQSVNG